MRRGDGDGDGDGDDDGEVEMMESLDNWSFPHEMPSDVRLTW